MKPGQFFSLDQQGRMTLLRNQGGDRGTRWTCTYNNAIVASIWIHWMSSTFGGFNLATLIRGTVKKAIFWFDVSENERKTNSISASMTFKRNRLNEYNQTNKILKAITAFTKKCRNFEVEANFQIAIPSMGRGGTLSNKARFAPTVTNGYQLRSRKEFSQKHDIRSEFRIHRKCRVL